MVRINHGQTIQMGRRLKAPLGLLQDLFLFAVLPDWDKFLCDIEVIGHENQPGKSLLDFLGTVLVASEKVLTNLADLALALGIVKHFVELLGRSNTLHRAPHFSLNC